MQPWIAAAFPLIFLLAAVQNVQALRSRGTRLTDVPIVLYNAGVGASLVFAACAVAGLEPPPGGSAVLYGYALAQLLVGSHLALLFPLSWHAPLLLRRAPADTWPGRLGLLGTSAFAAFVVVLLAGFRGEAERVVASFESEPRLAAPLREGLAVAVLDRPAPPPAVPAPGSWLAVGLALDEDPARIDRPDGPLAVVLRAGDRWLLRRPSSDEMVEAFLAAAERVAGAWRPELLIALPEPDGEAPLLLGKGLSPEAWRLIHAEARRRVRAASPGTRLALRLAGTSARSRALFEALAGEVDVAGPRLHPGGAESGGPAQVDAILAAWEGWLSATADAPELWILGAGLAPLAYGERAHARFVEGCLARASVRPSVAGILVLSWRSQGELLGLVAEDGRLRPAARALQDAFGAHVNR